ncbi:TPA: hypothetical protein N0F65_000600 [Lagenidium giganteum]|uniref:RING-type domain-containing protein n=1 Tax=Lagenidium giganteum TaxID=4803 RepID=A0AAV2YEZ2_9STRA|nr:TPA: hypothetical protein N0F65_000600 [Lagenidium giganteum]
MAQVIDLAAQDDATAEADVVEISDDEEDEEEDDLDGDDVLEDTEEEACCICQDVVELLRQGHLSACEHRFHFDCILTWSRVTNLCPLCKVKFNEITRKDEHGQVVHREQVKDAKQVFRADPQDHNVAAQLRLVNDIRCQTCGSGDEEHLLLLCEAPGCEVANHTFCIGLSEVPNTSWYCSVHTSGLRAASDLLPRRASTLSTRRTTRRLASLMSHVLGGGSSAVRRTTQAGGRRGRARRAPAPVSAAGRPMRGIAASYALRMSRELQQIQQRADAMFDRGDLSQTALLAPTAACGTTFRSTLSTPAVPANSVAAMWQDREQSRREILSGQQREHRQSSTLSTTSRTRSREFSAELRELLTLMRNAANKDAYASTVSVSIPKTARLGLASRVKTFFGRLNQRERLLALESGSVPVLHSWIQRPEGPRSMMVHHPQVLEAVLSALDVLPVRKEDLDEARGIQEQVREVVRSPQCDADQRQIARRILERWERLNPPAATPITSRALLMRYTVSSQIPGPSPARLPQITAFTAQQSSSSRQTTSHRGVSQLGKRKRKHAIWSEASVAYVKAKLYPLYKHGNGKLSKERFKTIVKLVAEAFDAEARMMQSDVILPSGELSSLAKTRLKLLIDLKYKASSSSSSASAEPRQSAPPSDAASSARTAIPRGRRTSYRAQSTTPTVRAMTSGRALPASAMRERERERAAALRDSQELRVCALVLSLLAFFLFIGAEVSDDAAWESGGSAVPLLALGTLGFAWIGPLTLLAGTMRSPKFRWWQPFEGGPEFVWMQAFGWSLHALMLTVAVVVLANECSRVTPAPTKWCTGQYLLLGLAGFFAQLLLNLSIGRFQPSAVGRPVFQFVRNTKAIVSLLLSTAGLLLFVVYDLLADRLLASSAIVAVGCVQFLLSALIIHVLYGWVDVAGYRLWQPFQGEKLFLLLQYLGWQFFACTLAGSAILIFSTDASAVRASFKGTPTTIGLMGFISQVLLLASLQHFDSREPRSCVHQPLSAASPLLPREVYMAGLLCASAIGANVAVYQARSHDNGQESSRHSLSVPLFLPAHEGSVAIIGIVAVALATPVAYAGGVRSRPSFRWWQPFLGGTKFVFLQTLGWFWYSLFTALSLLIALNGWAFARTAVPLALALGSAAATAISTSLLYFHPPHTATTADDSDHSHNDDRASESGDRTNRGLANRDVMLGLVLTVGGVLVHVCVDATRHHLGGAATRVALSVGTAVLALGCTVTHLSGKQHWREYRCWQPFAGGSRFVLRQAIAWTLFAVQLLLDALLVSCSAQPLPPGVTGGVGMFALLPELLLISSLELFQPSAASDQQTAKTDNSDKHVSLTELLQQPSVRWRLVVNVLVAFGAMGLFLGAECLLQRSPLFHADTTCTVLFIFGWMASVWGVVLTHCVTGPHMHRAYRQFQPFEGGFRFATIQGAGWTLVALAWVVACTAFYWRSVFFVVPGVHFVTGVLFFTAQVVLLCSLPFFQAPATSNRSHSRPSSPALTVVTAQPDLSLTPQHQPYYVGPYLGAAASAVFVLVDVAMVQFGPTIPVFPLTVCGVVALFSSIPLSYKVASSSSMAPHARHFGGSMVFIVLGSALWSFTMLLAAVFTYRVWMLESRFAAPTRSPTSTGFMGTFTGSVGITAQLLLLHAPDSPDSKNSPRRCPNVPLAVRNARHARERETCVRVSLASVLAVAAVVLAWVVAHGHTSGHRRMPTFQVSVVSLGSLIVMIAAWWIQYRILRSDAAVLLRTTTRGNKTNRTRRGHAMLERWNQDYHDHLASFLTTSEVARLSSCSRHLQAVYSDAFWRKLFYTRYLRRPSRSTVADGSDSDGSGTDSIIPEVLTQSQPFATTQLNRIETIALNVLCRLRLPERHPFLRPLRHRPGNKWKTLCIGREHDFLVEHCQICHQVELFSGAAKRWELLENCRRRTPSTWVVLCKCVDRVTGSFRKAHRTCLEQTMHPELVAPSLPFCGACQLCVREAGRLPKNTNELLRVTWHDFCTTTEGFGGMFFMFVPSSASVFILALRSLGFESLKVYAWVFLSVALCHLANTPRIDRCLRLVGDQDSPGFVAYARLFQWLTLTSLLQVALYYLTNDHRNSMRDDSATASSSSASSSSPSSWGLSSAWVQALLRLCCKVNLIWFVVLSLFLMASYWRSNYRVLTPASPLSGAFDDTVSPTAPLPSTTPLAEPRCVLCLLQLCQASG